jgi:hypothetical protein
VAVEERVLFFVQGERARQHHMVAAQSAYATTDGMAQAVEPSVQAFVTLVTSDSYAIGALVLAHSLRRTKTTRNIVVLATDNITLEKRYALAISSSLPLVVEGE